MEDVELAGVHARVHTDGPEEARAVLFVNSLGCDHAMWGPQVEDFATEHRVVRFDARGQDGTEVPPPPYALADLGADATMVLDHLGVERAHVVGVSLGGIVTLWLAANRAERLLSATYANTASRIGTSDGWEERIAAVRDGGMQAISGHVMERFFSERFRREHGDVVDRIRQRFEAHDRRGYIGYCMALRDGDLRPSLPDIATPSLVIGGREDLSTPPEQAHALREQVPNAELVMLDAGHLSNLERPTAFDDAVSAHLVRATRHYR